MRKKTVGFVDKKGNGEPVLVEEPATGGRGGPTKSLVCVCGRCTCRKHHCPVHFSATGVIITDKKLRKSHAPKTDYQETYNHTHPPCCRSSLKVPPTVFHIPPLTDKHSLSTVNREEYVQHPPQPMTVSFKPQEAVHSVKTRIEGDTSYKLDYPPREIKQRHRPSNQSTLRGDGGVPLADNYVTMNQAMLKRWSGNHCPPSYCEPHPSLKLFHGKFDGQSLFKDDFNEKIARLGRPRTSLKKAETMHACNGVFHGETTNRISFALPGVTTRDVVHLRNESKKNHETMQPVKGRMDDVTQYKTDHFWRTGLPHKQSMCEPQPDTLQLFRGPRETVTENRASFNLESLKDASRPNAFFNNSLQPHSCVGAFDDRTSNKVDFPPIPREKLLAQSKDIDKQAALIGYSHKMGSQTKRTQGIGFKGETTNQSHFKVWDISPRVRHGDRSERLFRPSNQPCAVDTETRANYVPVLARPPESCKPLDARFTPQTLPPTHPMCGTTSYSVDFLPKPLPLRRPCPAAELLLM